MTKGRLWMEGCGFRGCEEKRQQKGREWNENECVYTDKLKPPWPNEMDSVCEGLEAFRQTDERGLSKESRAQYLWRGTDR